jgi:hypothetical protein
VEKSLAAHIHRIVNSFVTTGSVKKRKSSGLALTRLSLQTGVPWSTCHKIRAGFTTGQPVLPQINEQMLLQIIFENKKVRARRCLEYNGGHFEPFL